MRCFVKVRLTFAIGDSTLTEIVRRQLNRNAVTGDNTDKMLPHLTGDVSYNLMAIFKLYSKLSSREGLDDDSRQFDYFFTCCHKYIFDIFAVPGRER